MTRSELSIEIDRELCMGSGTCTFHAPDTFDIDDEMKVVLLDGPHDDAEAIRAAVDGCPTRALRVVGTGPPTSG
jgi:ferredoxin